MMEEFPTIHIQIEDGYKIVGDPGVSVTYAYSGKMRHDVKRDIIPYDITFRIGGLSSQDVKDVKQFGRSYLYELITWTDQFTEEVYTAQIIAIPQVRKVEGGNATMEIRMRGTLNE